MNNSALAKQELKLFRQYRIRSQSENKTGFMSSIAHRFISLGFSLFFLKIIEQPVLRDSSLFST